MSKTTKQNIYVMHTKKDVQKIKVKMFGRSQTLVNMHLIFVKWLMINAFTKHTRTFGRVSFHAKCVCDYSKAPSSVLRFGEIRFVGKLVSYNLWTFNLNVFSFLLQFSSQEDMKWPTNDPNRIPFSGRVYLSSHFVP